MLGARGRKLGAKRSGALACSVRQSVSNGAVFGRSLQSAALMPEAWHFDLRSNDTGNCKKDEFCILKIEVTTAEAQHAPAAPETPQIPSN